MARISLTKELESARSEIEQLRRSNEDLRARLEHQSKHGDCQRCDGTGQYSKGECFTCHGTGKFPGISVARAEFRERQQQYSQPKVDFAAQREAAKELAQRLGRAVTLDEVRNYLAN